ncbi:MAG TPA: sensor domain-containing protein [Acidimicrobiales bacterium]|nr:sensor domain-containing protein [Acidimicrobiales bacterium]
MDVLRDPSARSVRSRPARRLLVGGVAGLLLLTAACSDDDEPKGDGTTTTAASTTAGGSDSSTTTEGGSGRPLNESDLVDSLVEPAAVAEGLEVSDTIGAGDFRPDVCPGQEIEVTWDDQASQSLLRTGGAGTLIVKQSVLAFSSADVADTFVDSMVAAVRACDPSVQIEDVPDVAERTSRFTAAQGGPPTAAGALLRQGSHVAYLEASGAPEVDFNAVVDPELLTQMAELLPE